MKLPNIHGKKEEGPAMEDRTLSINCRQCTFEPDYGNINCVKCICQGIFELGQPERILLSAGLDTEYSGDAVRIMSEISSVYAINSGDDRRKGKCATCRLSPVLLIDEVFASFQSEDTDFGICRLENAVTGDESCDICISRTKKILESVRDRLTETSRDALRSAYRIMGV